MDKKLDQILLLLKKFNSDELPKVLDNAFGDDAWEKIKAYGLKRKINLSNHRNVIMICLSIYKAQEPTAADAQKVLWCLKFFDVACHKNVTWKCAVLLNQIDNFPSDLETLRRKIIHSYRCEARDLEMIMTLKEDLIWLMVIEKKITKRGMKYGKPFFLVVHVKLDKKHVFFNPAFENDSSNKVDHLILISKALGFEDYRKVNFEGKDVKSLYEMIKRHKTEQNQIAVYQPKKFLLEDNVLDFTQGKYRKDYACDILPPGLTNLSTFTVHSQDEWRGDTPVCRPCLATTQLRIRTKSRSSSVENVIRELIFLGLVTIPVPHYISRLPYLNRNVVKLKNNGNENHNSQMGSDDETN